MKKLICVANPKSQNGTVGAKTELLREYLLKRQIEHHLLDLTTTEFLGELTKILRRGDAEVLLGIGGDGTHFSLMNTLQAIAAKHPEIKLPDYALCPLGTGNDIAKSIGLKVGVKNYRHVVDTALNGTSTAVDLGCWDGQYFADMVSAGMDATILNKREQLTAKLRNFPLLNKLLHGYVVYAIAGIITLIRRSRVRAEIRIDGDTWYDGPVCAILVNNCPVHAGEFILTPDARMDDGKLDILYIRNRIQYLLHFVLGWRHLPGFIRHGRCHRRTQGERIDVDLSASSPMQIDGEPVDASQSIRLTTVAGAIRLRIPSS
ncbi:hypothetical protein BVY04_03160 [bacterium M21]|nr:hypothetical protein BVY04_03160 [bacterium M21]